MVTPLTVIRHMAMGRGTAMAIIRDHISVMVIVATGADTAIADIMAATGADTVIADIMADTWVATAIADIAGDELAS